MSRQDGRISPRLQRAYRATHYTADGVAIQIGRRSEATDRLLLQLSGRTGVLITAWNPMSRPMPDGWNRRMQRRLAQRLRRWPRIQATGRWRRWEEAHLLVAADIYPMLRLARAFRQRAIVVLARRQPARLVFVQRPRGDRLACGSSVGHQQTVIAACDMWARSESDAVLPPCVGRNMEGAM